MDEPTIKTYAKVDLTKGKAVTTEDVLKHGNELVVKQIENSIALNSGSEIVERTLSEQKAITSVIENALVEGSHYGVMPGTTTKTLFQPGADVLAKMYGIQVKYEIIDKTLDIPSGYIDYEYRAILLWKGKEITSADASANTLEAKFRSHFQKLTKTDACEINPKQKYHRCENCEWKGVPGKSPFDIKNTIQQMAQKRAMVRGVRKALGITGAFTQDVEHGAVGATKEQKFDVYNALYVYKTSDMGKNETDRKNWLKLNVLKPVVDSVCDGRGFSKWSGEDTENIVAYLEKQEQVKALITKAKEVK